MSKTLRERVLEKLDNNKIVVTSVIIFTIIVGVATFKDAIMTVFGGSSKEVSPQLTPDSNLITRRIETFNLNPNPPFIKLKLILESLNTELDFTAEKQMTAYNLLYAIQLHFDLNKMISRRTSNSGSFISYDFFLVVNGVEIRESEKTLAELGLKNDDQISIVCYKIETQLVREDNEKQRQILQHAMSPTNKIKF